MKHVCLLATLACVAACADANRVDVVGLTETSPDGTCLAAISDVQRGSTLVLLQPDSPVTIRATVENPTSTCVPLNAAQVRGEPYRLRIDGSAPPELLAIAFRSEPPREIRVRKCTSYEGIHLTVWAGEPLKSNLIWHQYYYLGFDVEPTCEDGEIGL
jgi:hypothetical protein